MWNYFYMLSITYGSPSKNVFEKQIQKLGVASMYQALQGPKEVTSWKKPNAPNL